MSVVLSNRGIWDDKDGYEIIEITQYLPRWDGGSYFYCDVRNTRTGEVFKHTMYCTVTMYLDGSRD